MLCRDGAACGVLIAIGLLTGSVHAATAIPALHSGVLIRNHDAFSLWHQPQGGGALHVGDTPLFPRQERRAYALFGNSFSVTLVPGSGGACVLALMVLSMVRPHRRV